MRGHGRLLRGLTPPERAEAVLSDANPGIGRWLEAPQSVVDVRAYRRAKDELRTAHVRLVWAEVWAGISTVAAVALVGARLAGL